MRRIIVYCLLMATFFPLAGCFHKDNKTGSTDNVEDLYIYTGSEGSFIILKETVFHVTSKKRGGGMNVTTGSSTVRLSNYDLATGKLVSRVVIGDLHTKSLQFLGMTANKLWFFSMEKDKGLHSRDPKSLEVLETQEQLAARTAALKQSVREIKFYEVPKYYGFDHDSRRIIYTDISGNKFLFDPVSGQTTATDMRIESRNFSLRFTSSSAYAGYNNTINLQGDKRKTVHDGKNKPANLSFLEGEFIMASLPERKAELKQWMLTDLEKNRSRFGYERDYTSAINTVQEGRAYHIAITDSTLRNYYILHQTSISDSAKVMFSKIQVSDDAKLSLLWETTVASIYREPERAEKMGSFEELFAKGNPQLKTMWADKVGDRLVFIFNLRTICIDTNTGKILWDNAL
jgi:hypothetical protein